MFRALPGAHDYVVDYRVGRFLLGLLRVGGQVRLGLSSVWAVG